MSRIRSMVRVMGIAAVALAPFALGARAAQREQFCTYGKAGDIKGETIACYSEAGCKFAASLGGDPIADYDVGSAPFALARGKIAGIVTSSPQLIAQVKKVQGKCRPLP